jgi:hypothetical protein
MAIDFNKMRQIDFVSFPVERTVYFGSWLGQQPHNWSNLRIIEQGELEVSWEERQAGMWHEGKWSICVLEFDTAEAAAAFKSSVVDAYTVKPLEDDVKQRLTDYAEE